ncbi:hypothetical protein AAVH_39842 [Aphelenchoides avenae]|nr:hypothetical protein AAVH_39842 [Aphelenchus avenae]
MEIKFPDTGRFELSLPFFSLKAVHDCNKLEIYGEAQYPVEATELCEWLHREKKWDDENCSSKKATKVLRLYETAVSNVNEFLGLLKTELKAASKPRPYEMTLYSHRYNIGLNESHHHKKTFEIMTVESGDDDFQEPPCYILVKREIKKNQRYFEDDSDDDGGSEQGQEDASDDAWDGGISDYERDNDDDEEAHETDSAAEADESGTAEEDNAADCAAKRRRLAR